jgi:hypothetical protein
MAYFTLLDCCIRSSNIDITAANKSHYLCVGGGGAEEEYAQSAGWKGHLSILIQQGT